MALIMGIGLFAISVLTAALSRVLAEEFAAWAPSINRALIRAAVGRLPENLRERSQEEWQSHLYEVPGNIGKILSALGFVVAARRVASSTRRGHQTNALSELRNSYSRIQIATEAILGQQDPPIEDGLAGYLKGLGLHASRAQRALDGLPYAAHGPVGYIAYLWIDRVVGKHLVRTAQEAAIVRDDVELTLKGIIEARRN